MTQPGTQSGTRSGPHFGQDLKREREQRGISLEMLCAETRVQTRHLLALEQGDYAALPGGVFRRGIARAYLKALGLEEEAWLPQFQRSFQEYAQVHGIQETAGGESWAEFAENVKRNRTGARQSNGLRWAGVGLLLLVVVAAGWYTYRVLLHGRVPF